MSPGDAKVLMRVWLLFLLMRDAAASRPILTLLGQPGAGKSTLFKRIYALLYGPRRSLGSITKPDDFDQATTLSPLLVLDNADTWERWLPDRLALSASTSEVVRRKLYTDVDSVTLRRQAMLGLTAHSPRFGREDVNDRLIILTFERLTKFQSETEILGRITSLRNDIWGGMIKDIQHVLRTPMPAERDLVQFRVEDFARLGTWIATAIGDVAAFARALSGIRGDQKVFTLEEEQMLVEAISTFNMRCKDPDSWRTASQLWSLFETYSGDPRAFANRYRNPVLLGRKLWSLQDSLKTMFGVEWQFSAAQGTRVWRFRQDDQAGLQHQVQR